MKKLTALLSALLLSTFNMYSQGFEVTPDIAPMNVTRVGHIANTLPDGRVLVIGGHTTGFALTSTAEIYDPLTNTWTLYEISNPHDGASAVRLQDGRYMFMGGCSSGSGVGQSSVTTIFDPNAGAFSDGPQMNTARTNSTAMVLGDGRVLVAGNWYNTADAEIYDPETDTFTPLGVPVQSRAYPLIFPCDDGTAVILGGYNNYGGFTFTDVVSFDPVSSLFSTLSEQIIPGETGWQVYWSGNSQLLQDAQMSNGKYVFSVFKTAGSNTYYGFATFDPSTKVIEGIMTTPEFPYYTGTNPDGWAFGLNPMLHPTNQNVYVTGVNSLDGTIKNRLYAFNPSTGELSIPEGDMATSYYLYSASKAWIGENLLCTGGTVDGSNFNVTSEVMLLTPQSTLTSLQESDLNNGLSVYPNPVNGTSFMVTLPSMEFEYLEIIDNRGRLLRRVNTENRGSLIEIDIGDLTPGIYMLRIVSPEQSREGRLIVE